MHEALSSVLLSGLSGLFWPYVLKKLENRWRANCCEEAMPVAFYFIMTMNAGLLHLNIRMGIIHVEEIRHVTKSRSVRRVDLNISELGLSQCLWYILNFSFLLFFFLQSWTAALELYFKTTVLDLGNDPVRVSENLSRHWQRVVVSFGCFLNPNRVFGFLVS